jgi:hypothetical protein
MLEHSRVRLTLQGGTPFNLDDGTGVRLGYGNLTPEERTAFLETAVCRWNAAADALAELERMGEEVPAGVHLAATILRNAVGGKE